MNKIGRWFALVISCFFLGHAMYQFSLGFDLSEHAAGATAWILMAFVAVCVVVQIIVLEDQARRQRTRDREKKR